MRRVILVLIGALLGVSCVIGGLYVVLDHTTLVSGALPAASGDQPAPANPTEVVATVNGVAITRQMVESEVKISRLNVAEPLSPLQGEDLARSQADALNQLINRQLILQAAARQNFQLDDAFVEAQVDLLFGGYGDAALDQALQQIGATREEVHWWVREIFTVEQFSTEVIMAGAAPEQRQQVYNEWLNQERAVVDIQIHAEGQLQNSLGLDEPAPDFTLLTPDNQSVSLSDYRGQVVLVNFWATWCPSCLSEMPDYEQVYQRYQDKFVVLGVNYQESASHAAEYAAGLQVTYPVLLDQAGEVATRQYQVPGMPASFLIDPQGNIFYRHLGPMSGKTLEEKLAELGL